jgi:hypothetical protein
MGDFAGVLVLNTASATTWSAARKRISRPGWTTIGHDLDADGLPPRTSSE